MADMFFSITSKLIKFTPLAYVETKLESKPGSTLSASAGEYAVDDTEIERSQAYA